MGAGERKNVTVAVVALALTLLLQTMGFVFGLGRMSARLDSVHEDVQMLKTRMLETQTAKGK